MNPTDLVSYDWCKQTGGSLTPAQRRMLLARSLRAYAGHAADLARLAAGRRDESPVALPTAPDARLVEVALEACRDQGPAVEGHGLRSWLFGGALANRDGVTLDPELFCVAAIAHDAGTARAVAGQDFTVRSADLAMAALDLHDSPWDEDQRRELRDGIVAHATSGVTPQESAIGTYVQAGALLDLAGMRLVDLPKATVAEVFDRHPNTGIKSAITRVIDEEARLVPHGRFAQLRRLGLTVAIRTSPTLRRA